MTEVFGGVLCAGFGTRLRPITEVVPKPLVPFLNTPIVTYGLHILRAAGISRIGLNLHHLVDTIPPVVDRLAPILGFSPVYIREWEIMGTGGGIRGIWKGLGESEGVLVVINGDSVADLDLSTHLQRHMDSGNDVTLVVRPKAPSQPGRVFLDESMRLSGIRGFRRPGATELTEYEFTGIHILNSSAVTRLALEPSDVVDALYGPMVAGDEAIGASVCDDGFWAALDSPQLLLESSRQVLANPEVFKLAPLPEPMSDGLYIYNPNGINNQAQLAGPIFLGGNVTVAANAWVGPNVVMDGVELAPGARVENAILFGMGRIEGEWRDCVAIAGRVATL